MGSTQTQLDAARAFDAKMARERFRLTPFKGGRMTRVMSVTTLMQLYKHCPPGVATAADRKKFMEENERLFLDHNTQKTPPGMVNRHGRVTSRTYYFTDGRKAELRM